MRCSRSLPVHACPRPPSFPAERLGHSRQKQGGQPQALSPDRCQPTLQEGAETSPLRKQGPRSVWLQLGLGVCGLGPCSLSLAGSLPATPATSLPLPRGLGPSSPHPHPPAAAAALSPLLPKRALLAARPCPDVGGTTQRKADRVGPCAPATQRRVSAWRPELCPASGSGGGVPLGSRGPLSPGSSHGVSGSCTWI